jgi:hypothetical protein
MVLAQELSKVGVQFNNEKARISTQLLDCVDRGKGIAKQYVRIEVENRLEESMVVTFKREMWFDGKCLNCNSDSSEYISSLTLEANETIRGTCGESRDLLIFSKMLELKGVRQLSHFELKNINIQKL